MNALEVSGLKKSYGDFSLDVSFALEQGKITGFIGRNGAGKTTTIKSLLGFVHPDAGEIRFFSMPFAENEMKIKSRLGVVLGGVNYYAQKRLSAVAAVTSRFYPEWDDSLYGKYMRLFSLDESKRISELSAGMKVKFSLALALSHSADLLILDEPTSGLDPVSRDELLDIFISLSQDEGKTVFCSTHITSDLDRCADNIIYLKQGRIAENEPLCTLLQKYSVVRFSADNAPNGAELIGVRREKDGMSALVRNSELPAGVESVPAGLEDIMLHIEREDETK